MTTIPLVIGPTDGIRTILDATGEPENIFQAVTGRFEEFKLAETPPRPRLEVLVDIFSLIPGREGDMHQLFSSVAGEEKLSQLWFTQDQIATFCNQSHPQLFSPIGPIIVVFFLLEEEGELYVVAVDSCSCRGKRADTAPLSKLTYKYGSDGVRLVVPVLL